MTASRRLLLAAAAVLPLALAACDNKCPTSTAKISQVGGVPTGVPTCADVPAGQTVTVELGVCPRCDQTNDICNVIMPDAVDPATIQLDPLVQTCDPRSCDLNPSCAPVPCTFKAPATPGTYRIRVVDFDLGTIDRTFTVVDGGANTSCSI